MGIWRNWDMRPEVPEGWGVESLGSVVDVLLSNVDKKSSLEDVPVRLCNYMDVYANTRITAGLPFMEATATTAQVEKFRLRMGDVLITKDSEDPSDIAVPSVVADEFEEPVVCGYHLAILRPRNVDGAYLSWALRSRPVNDQFTRKANGTTRFGLTNDVIRSTEIPLPPLPEQREIAAILASVDDAIAATRNVIEQTELVKQGLLQALMTRGIAHTRFKTTEIGEIPTGWELKKFGELVRPVFIERPVLDDQRYRPVVVRRRHGGVETPEEKLGSTILVKQQYAPVPGLFLISKRQIIHLACGIVPGDVAVNATISKEYLQLRSTGALDLAFLELYSRRPAFYRSIERCTYGVDREKFVLNVPLLMNEPVPVPSKAEQAEIVKGMEMVSRDLESHRDNLRSLERLKTSLLQDLLTGRVRVHPD